MSLKLLARLEQAARRIKHDAMTVYFTARDPRTPWHVRLLALAIAAYALSPIDLIPDFIPVLGYLDDLIILPAMVALTVRLIPAEVMAACRAQAVGMWQNGKPKRWYYALPIVLVWLLVVFLIVRAVVKPR